MNKHCRRFTIIPILILNSSLISLAQPPLTENAIRVYQHGGYEGSSGYIYQTELDDLGSWNHQISSLQVPAGYQLIAYEGINYQGGSRIFIGNWTITPSDIIWNDRICSVKWMKIIYTPPTPVPDGGIKLWENENFVLPATITYKYEEANLYFWDNQVGSIQVPAGYKMIAWEELNFQGASIEISGDWTPGGSTQGWNKRISSYKVIKNGGETIPVPEPENIVYIPPTRQFVNLTNKYRGDEIGLSYNIDDQKFSLTGTISNWKIVSYTPGNYKIMVDMRGKLWALTSTREGTLFLSEPSSEPFQLWVIEKREDGYYRISNKRLLGMDTQKAFLFSNSVTNELFLYTWAEQTSLNGRWKLTPHGKTKETEDPDPLNKLNFTLKSYIGKKNMCLTQIYTSDATFEIYIMPCENKRTTITFYRSITGYCFIRMNVDGTDNYMYLDYSLKSPHNRYGGSDLDLIKPDPADTWNVVLVDNEYYVIMNTLTQKVLELVKGYNGEYHIEMRPLETRKAEQLWYLYPQ